MTAKSKYLFELIDIKIILNIPAIGVPIKLLHEAEGHVVTVELKTGEAYRGLLEESEDTMNCRMKEGKCEQIYTPHLVNIDNCYFISDNDG